jgi:conjugal transfer pilus assembly protein TraI
MLTWVFHHVNALGLTIGIPPLVWFLGRWTWRRFHKYPNLFQEIMNQPAKAPQAGVHYPPPAAGIEIKSLKGFWVTHFWLPKSIKRKRELKRILAPHRDLLDRIEKATETAHVYEKRYWPAIERYANLVHLLPASADDHHCLQGGLLHHGLQTGFFALEQAQDGLYGMNLGEKKRDGRERWLFAAFIAGLCHDQGKVVTDLEVSTGQGGMIWPSASQKLLNWAIKNRVSKYYVDWKPNRYKLHEKVAPHLMDEVLTKDDIEYLQKIDKGLYEELLKTLVDVSDSSADNPYRKNPDNLREMVRKADNQSVDEDSKKSRSPADLGIETATPLVRYYTDVIRQQFKEGEWSINKPSGEAWVLGRKRNLYLVWPRCGLDLYNLLSAAGIQGVPKDSDVIAESLARWEVIETAPGGGIYWRIKPGETEGDNPTVVQIPLAVIRFKDNWGRDLAGLLPPGLAGMVEAEEGERGRGRLSKRAPRMR